VTEDSRDAAVFLAMACTEIVMAERAVLGDFEGMIEERPNFDRAIAESLVELATEQGYSPLVARGMLDRNLVIHRVRSRVGPPERRLIAAEDLDRAKWIDEGQVKAAGTYWKLSAQLARELGVARHVVPSPGRDSLPKVYALYGLENVRNVGHDWLDDLSAFLRQRSVAVLLILVGITGLILELKIPGFGVPGVIAAICFTLYFWAHSQLSGHLTMLAVLLGLALIAVEVFVLPGFGVTGISGILLVILSLALATLAQMPRTTYEWVEFGATLSSIGLTLTGAVAAAFAFAYYLPHIPYAKRLVLDAEREDERLEVPADVPSPSERYASLLGAIGEAATTLRPAGKARFGEEYLDVIAEGSYVQPGTRIQVVEIEGNRIVVKEV
jgi:membrane-bound ClpP family serine protease